MSLLQNTVSFIWALLQKRPIIWRSLLIDATPYLYTWAPVTWEDVCLHIWKCLRTFVHTYVYIHTYTRTSIHAYWHTYMHTYKHTYAHTHTYTYTYTRAAVTEKVVSVRIYIHTHTYTHTHICCEHVGERCLCVCMSVCLCVCRVCLCASRSPPSKSRVSSSWRELIFRWNSKRCVHVCVCKRPIKEIHHRYLQ